MATPVKTTPLNDWHRQHGANMADFGGYDMPLWYSSVKEEHLAVLTGAGIFDTSHMAAVIVDGAGAAGLLQHCFTNDLDACMGPARKPLSPGRCVYGAFLDENAVGLGGGRHGLQVLVLVAPELGSSVARLGHRGHTLDKG